ncbi:MAG: hypothetical protein OEY14_02610 [Myxococcales bacterium]|nr:hypothetical protein [Myxococcales bacterium]
MAPIRTLRFSGDPIPTRRSCATPRRSSAAARRAPALRPGAGADK